MSITGIADGKAASLNMLHLHVCWAPVGEDPCLSVVLVLCCMDTTFCYCLGLSCFHGYVLSLSCFRGYYLCLS